MKRLENYFCWNSIEDWMNAQKCGLVALRNLDGQTGQDDVCKRLTVLLELAENDCFPIALVCLKEKDGYFIQYDRMLYSLFRFINNEIFIQTDGNGKMYFDEFDSNKKGAVLRAKIFSVWIDISSDENFKDSFFSF